MARVRLKQLVSDGKIDAAGHVLGDATLSGAPSGKSPLRSYCAKRFRPPAALAAQRQAEPAQDDTGQLEALRSLQSHLRDEKVTLAELLHCRTEKDDTGQLEALRSLQAHLRDEKVTLAELLRCRTEEALRSPQAHLPDEKVTLAGLLQCHTEESLKIQSLLSDDPRTTVYKAAWERTLASGTVTSVVVEVKVLKSSLDRVRTSGSDDVRRQREALALPHPNIAQCFDSSQGPPHFIVTEYCAGGILFDLLHHSKAQLSTSQRVTILSDVSCGMKYLHQRMVLHRDLNSCSVRLAKPILAPTQQPVAKLADFGRSRSAIEHLSRPLTMGIGMWRWMAPEMFVPEDEGGHYTWSADVYSYGIVMYEVFARKVPYIDDFPTKKDGDPRMSIKVLHGMRPDVRDVSPDCPRQVTDLMQGCWDGDPERRPTFEKVYAALREVILNYVGLQVLS